MAGIVADVGAAAEWVAKALTGALLVTLHLGRRPDNRQTSI
jgi:hypothetical protein